mgnify:CR=1 FL=1
MSKIVLIVGVVVVVLGAAYFFMQSSTDQGQPAVEETGEEMVEEMGEMMEEGHSMMAEHTVVYSAAGYSPKELTIKKGEKVTFRNESARETWPASAMHPSHTAYPGSSIQKCESEEMTSIFDACMGLQKGEEWSFVFDESGEWFYHDHKMPDMFGKIIVQE